MGSTLGRIHRFSLREVSDIGALLRWTTWCGTEGLSGPERLKLRLVRPGWDSAGRFRHQTGAARGSTCPCGPARSRLFTSAHQQGLISQTDNGPTR